ncbi:MAG: fasciclin domain-containing protein [Gemmatimonadetes bacterium]|nr:fasciclin domain-containing protein [Gemmatimonadota bacterium]
MKAHAFALIAAGTLALSACTDESQPFEPTADRVNIPAEPARDPIAKIAIDGGFTQLVAALQYVDAELSPSPGLVNLFLANNNGPFTVFAPTDDAFVNLYGLLTTVLGSYVNEITDVPASVVLEVLKYHVVDGRRPAAVVLPKTGERSFTTLQGESFWVSSSGTIRHGLGPDALASIVAADVRATNGVIHVIDQVILPPSLVAALTGN